MWRGAGFKQNVGKGAKQKLINPAINYLVSLNRTCIADNFNKLTLNLDLLTFACVHTFSLANAERGRCWWWFPNNGNDVDDNIGICRGSVSAKEDWEG